MKKKLILVCLLLGIVSLFSITAAFADPIPNIDIQIGDSGAGKPATSSLSILLLITVISIAPALLVLMTSFTRIVIVLGFVRTSLGTQQMPPNQVLVGLALFLTLFVMSPTLSSMNDVALQPYLKGDITQTEALTKASEPIKKFMFSHTREKDLLLFMNYTKMEKPATYNDIPLTVMVPSFAISELKTAFQMGFMIFIPFLVIDIVVASVLMAMGMMMLPPVMISLPFKILLFVLVDGWYLIVKSLLLSFNT
ncbi:flagellar type III secretion system pore protein FliP [Paenibacillus macquariensis]|uniref:Flagellar biosynthetic protein FliP n=1 Tax=Paenibacillus macquariensis TaxID=948756 RepID=A0ABY1JZU0_9BACL|nr:flagellar type III secretion system pore protein FliP [Paenibacillus macquariensis]MEC0091394.1 flagellar type III secretion system pore protein FliP [Paenibacillus macquariensis]OAB38077.1 flagellar biosynthetic protein FliP [Paenibacillus macquariensis subsp. macquariensis]SIR05795.1 flagellar biosynthetic protein FliP [Paenibacillus macquariensis]